MDWKKIAREIALATAIFLVVSLLSIPPFAKALVATLWFGFFTTILWIAFEGVRVHVKARKSK